MALDVVTQYGHWVKGLDPVADAFAGTVRSDVVRGGNHRSVTFLIYKGVGATGTSTITVEANDDVTPSNSTAIPFKYRACTTGDTWGALTDATTTGFATTAGSSQLYEIIVDTDELGDTGYRYLSLKAVEVVDSPVLGGILIMMNQPRIAQATPATAIV
jgi:hypothetical protein